MKVCILGPFWSRDVRECLKPEDADRLARLPGMGGFSLPALVRQRLARGRPTEVITLDPGAEKVEVFEGDGLTYTVCPRRRRGLSRSFYRREVEYLRAALARSTADVIHANWAYEYALAAVGARRPCLVTVRDHAASILRHVGRTYLVNFLITLYVIRRARHLSAVSPYNAAFVRRLARRPVPVVPNSASPACLAMGDRLAGMPLFAGGAPTVAAAISIARYKNPWTALEGFAVLRRRYPTARFRLMGIGLDATGPVAAWARERGLAAGVEFMGNCTHEEVLRVMSDSDILLHPSTEEACSSTVVEAMALGRAIVAGRGAGGTPWVLDEGRAGLLVDVTDPAAIGAALIELVAEPERAAARARHAFARARGMFAPDAMADQYEALYAEALAG